MEALKAAAARSCRTVDLFRECQRAKRGKYLDNDLTSELYEVFGTHVLLGTPEMERYAGMLLRDIQASAPARGRAAAVDAHHSLLPGTAEGAAEFQRQMPGGLLRYEF